MPPPGPVSRTLAPLLAAAVAAGCSSYARHAPLFRDALAREDYDAALAEVEKIGTSGSELLYCYEKGLILHERGDYAESNRVLERAEQVLDELYTRSISREVAAVTVSEAVAKYRGDPFEAVMVNYYKIINYLHLGLVEDALVECRRLNLRLQMIHDAGETGFVEAPFLQYVTALVYELGREWDSAGVSYRTAIERYGEPGDSTDAGGAAWLYCDAAANAEVVGDEELAAFYRARAACDPAPTESGRVAVLVEYGSIARKIETAFTVPILEGDDCDAPDYAGELASRRGVVYGDGAKVKYWLRVALPALEVDPPSFVRAVVRAIPAGGRGRGERAEAGSVRVADLDDLAARAFADAQGTIVLRAVARALAKYLASQTADGADEALGALVNILGVVTETADTRSWTTLPRSIHLARLDLEPGAYRIEAEVLDESGACVERASFADVRVTRGGLAVRRLRVLLPPPSSSHGS
jgi:hypothetical protein